MTKQKPNQEELKKALTEASKNLVKDDKEVKKDFKNEENETIDEWKKEVSKEIIKTPSYYEVEKVIERVINGYGNGCLIISEGGLSKTTIAKTILKNKNVDYAILNTFTTPLAFYRFLLKNYNRVVLLDDVIGLWDNIKSVAMLKSALELEDRRLICYESESPKSEDMPRAFTFTGRLIILTNRIDVKNAHINAVEDRLYIVNLKIPLREKLIILEQINRSSYKNLDEIQRKECLDLIKKYATEKTKLTIRTLIKIYNIYLSCSKEEFEKQALFELNVDKERIILNEISNLEIAERNKIWEEATGKSVRTLQRNIKETKDLS